MPNSSCRALTPHGTSVRCRTPAQLQRNAQFIVYNCTDSRTHDSVSSARHLYTSAPSRAQSSSGRSWPAWRFGRPQDRDTRRARVAQAIVTDAPAPGLEQTRRGVHRRMHDDGSPLLGCPENLLDHPAFQQIGVFLHRTCLFCVTTGPIGCCAQELHVPPPHFRRGSDSIWPQTAHPATSRPAQAKSFRNGRRPESRGRAGSGAGRSPVRAFGRGVEPMPRPEIAVPSLLPRDCAARAPTCC